MNARALASIDRLNPMIVGLLHTPVLHWVASVGLMTITLTGRRSGRTFRFPVGYHDQSDAVLVLVADAKGRQWWRNFESPWPASLEIRGHTREVMGEVLEAGTPEYSTRVGLSFARAAFIPAIFGIRFDRARGLTNDQIASLADTMSAVCFRMSDARRARTGDEA